MYIIIICFIFILFFKYTSTYAFFSLLFMSILENFPTELIDWLCVQKLEKLLPLPPARTFTSCIHSDKSFELSFGAYVKAWIIASIGALEVLLFRKLWKTSSDWPTDWPTNNTVLSVQREKC